MDKSIKSVEGFCSGCGACKLICPADAIKIERSREGFFEAVVIAEKCINCGKCQEVCLKKDIKKAQKLTEGSLVSAQSKDEKTVLNCTSGGIAHEMSRYAIENGWSVVGVKYDFQKNIARTVLANNEQEIEAFKGSKYIQSYTVDGFEEAIAWARKDKSKKILAFGTPCQIYGFASALETLQIREQFILVDLFCHGVPSYLVWDEYLKQMEAELGIDKLSAVTFRDKSIGWHNFVMKLQKQDKTYLNSSEGDLFYHAFFDNILFCGACFDCAVRKELTKADIRLGDFWGKRYQSREDGVSAVLICTDRGREFFEANPYINTIEETSVEEVLMGQSIYTYPYLHLRNKGISELSGGKDLKKVIKAYRAQFPLKRKLKICLKESTAKLPDGARAFIRKIYKKI